MNRVIFELRFTTWYAGTILGRNVAISYARAIAVSLVFLGTLYPTYLAIALTHNITTRGQFWNAAYISFTAALAVATTADRLRFKRL